MYSVSGLTKPQNARIVCPMKGYCLKWSHPSIVNREQTHDINVKQEVALMPGVALDNALELSKLAEGVRKRRESLTYSREALAAALKTVTNAPTDPHWATWRFCYQRECDCVRLLSESVANYDQLALAVGQPVYGEEGPRAGRPRKWISLPQAYLARQAFQKERDDWFRLWKIYEYDVFVEKLVVRVEEERAAHEALAIYESRDCRLRLWAKELLKPRGDNHCWPATSRERAREAGVAIMGYLKAKSDLTSVRCAIVRFKAEAKVRAKAEQAAAYRRDRDERDLANASDKQKTYLPPAS